MRADRLLAELLLLQRHGRMTARAMAEHLEVCERTIYRDLDALSAAGVPVYVERGRQGGCRLVEGYRTELTGLNSEEVRTLFAARAVGHLADLGLGAAGDAVLLKLLAALPAIYRPLAERALERTYLDASEWFRPAEAVPFLPVVQEAVWQDRRVRLTYRHGSGATADAEAEPLGLVAKGRVWYLVARADGDVRVFRVARILAAELCEGHMARPAGFDLRAFWHAWCRRFEQSIPRYAVALRVAPAALERLGWLLGPEARGYAPRAEPPDAAGWVMVDAEFERLEDARRGLLGCGPLVEVLAPAELRQSLADASAGLAALYARDEA